jgi:hypothetical protein
MSQVQYQAFTKAAVTKGKMSFEQFRALFSQYKA